MDDDVDDIVREFLVESYENLDQLDRDLVELEEHPGSRPLLSSVFRTIHTIKGTSGFLALGRLERVTHVGESLLVELRDGRRVMDQATTDVLLAMVDKVRELLAAVEVDGTEGAVAVEDVVAAVEAVRATAPVPAPVVPAPHRAPDALVTAAVAPPVAPGAETAAAPAALVAAAVAHAAPPAAPAAPVADAVTPPAAGAEDHAHQRGVGESAIRVDVHLLDALVRQVGELVLARNRISLLAAGTHDTALVRSAQQLDLIAGELQEGVMRTRMQPIEHVWSKMPRVVRDLATACGREVHLEVSGGDTELDRGLLEAVKDPLTHLVRNAVDHGIEPPDVRVAAGKPARGVVSLRAYHTGGQVVVEVADDGRGIDPLVVGAKAVERGLRTPAQVAQASEADLLRLLFLPGFSTAPAVTAVSGRGVGMDVVRTKIEAVGGTVDVESTVGAGTVWRLRVPLTLAIMPALTVECAGDVFALPQVDLLELVALDDRRGTAGVEEVHGARVHRLRGDLLPLVPLTEVLGVTPAAGAAEGRVVAVVQAEQRFGLLVDRVLNTEEIVVKALSGRLKSLGVYAGATVLGDGRVALILDVQGLARRARVTAVEGGSDDAAAVTDEVVTRQMLVVGVGEDRRVAMPLEEVARLEQLRPDQVERVGGREVVRYRGGVLPLARLDALLGVPRAAAGAGLLVVVLERAGRTAGLVVTSIVDITEDRADQHADVVDHGLLGATVLGGRVTELLDVRAAVLAADPAFYGTAPEPVGAGR
ncbi:chemotaxis protein CheW [Cellulomonas sp. zg-ZUI222]|uniref:chemotaxis protein CheW n=1 Tax=Cellulomonas wangleii TaxID=2816956 RepID=UPI001A945B6D|nr:chemotaxis protein CheW [Cellulomonas wangleii]MBO0922437.1 chemotaxis protein CheW [Cellulomonas wangleii]